MLRKYPTVETRSFLPWLKVGQLVFRARLLSPPSNFNYFFKLALNPYDYSCKNAPQTAKNFALVIAESLETSAFFDGIYVALARSDADG
jgi:hypothetical protein